jgi:hypothetical protein
MRIVSVVHAKRRLLAAALIGMHAFSGGCGGGEMGESTATPPTPPAGRSAKDRAAAIKAGREESQKEEAAAPKKAPGGMFKKAMGTSTP